MSYVLIIPNDATIQYPYSLYQLRQDNPNVSFPSNPTAEDLEPFNVFHVQKTDPPTDTRTHRASEGLPERDNEGFWHQTWELREATSEELLEWDEAHKPPADWVGFGQALQLDNLLVEAFNSAAQVSLLSAIALSRALQEAESGAIDRFYFTWSAWCATVNPSQDAINQFANLASQYNLPEAFQEAILNPLTPPG